ncbi:diguanylate cyclase (GGDEF) domain-containing protein [Marinobacter persicus]|uniref:diguanylate cyclase n=1 Tax=Marinobacter persicus TaxID=930118 RepID=A0A1I3SV70_9GAMM|nr:sensor domain-containing diguanylate cyclase [Marinobacter persicus]GHD40966.1 GGDEF domain-containing protein [Marinobacter persicus]SFJ62102.1 diguanylate cyclase (GGDEF) domain-containing protein [Marinobacter persicus]
METRIPSLNLPARNGQAVDTGATSAAGMQAILDNLDALVYVSDFDTHDLLYMNDYGRRIWGDIRGRKCWQVLQDGDGPCDFCTNHLLRKPDGLPAGTHVWEFQNQLDKRWYQCRDQAIHWTDGRLVRLEIATDITERKEMELSLKQAHEAAHKASLTDQLTGLNNRRAFFHCGGQLLSQAQRYKTPLALIMMDLDFFKQVNDTHGHEAGDEVLKHIAGLLHGRVRDSDCAARMGGEEFALLLPEADALQAREMAERLLKLILGAEIVYRGHKIPASASFGVTVLADGDQRLEDLMLRADRALYRAKDLGRSQVNVNLPDA